MSFPLPDPMRLALDCAADAAAAGGRAGKAVEEARLLLDRDAREIARFCGLDEDDEVPGVGGLPQQRRVEDRRWQKITAFRDKIFQLMEDLR